jgi:hypothetical protein
MTKYVKNYSTSKKELTDKRHFKLSIINNPKSVSIKKFWSLPEAHLGEHRNAGTLAVPAGFVLMMILDVALG